MATLRFDNRNAKAGSGVYTVSLPAGHTCPGALRVPIESGSEVGKISDGPLCKFRSLLCVARTARMFAESRWRNLEMLLAPEARTG